MPTPPVIFPRPIRAELLMPAGSLEKLKLAILYGADAVYCGTPDMSLRSKSAFSLEQLKEGIAFAHDRGKRVYLTLNLFSHNKDIPKLAEYVATVREAAPDGLIVADPGVFQYVKTHAPELELHISTQANLCSWLSVQFWQEQGAALCVMAREVSYEELKEIREHCPDIKLEAFIHGAMCMTYSGRCLLSNYMAERGANQGSCANSCRWNYTVHMKLKDGTLKEIELNEHNKDLFEFFLEEEHRGGELMPLEEDDKGSYILNAKDLCLMPKLDDYLRIGIDSLKVEGRGRSPYYVAIVARAYRAAIDAWYADPEHWSPEPFMRELETIPNKGYSLAFHEGRLSNTAHNYQDTRTLATWEYAGMVTEVREDALLLQVKNRIAAGDVLEFVPPSGPTVLLRIYEMHDITTGNTTDVVNAGTQPVLRIPFAWFDREDPAWLRTAIPEMTVVRKETPLTRRDWQRLALDREAQKLETGNAVPARYAQKQEALRAAIAEDNKDRRFKSPRLGTEGCCGRGCNGCLIFWHDPAYAKARSLLASRKQGELLTG